MGLRRRTRFRSMFFFDWPRLKPISCFMSRTSDRHWLAAHLCVPKCGSDGRGACTLCLVYCKQARVFLAGKVFDGHSGCDPIYVSLPFNRRKASSQQAHASGSGASTGSHGVENQYWTLLQRNDQALSGSDLERPEAGHNGRFDSHFSHVS